jgi:hypothetical protein
METSSRVCGAVLEASRLLSAQLARHGVCEVLIQVCQSVLPYTLCILPVMVFEALHSLRAVND